MIHYQLHCHEDHCFEGWFRDSAAFEEQSRRRLLSCPQCGSPSVTRALMSPPVVRGRTPARVEPPAPARTEAVLPDQMRAILQRLRSEVELHCDDVGDGFAEAARRAHRREDAAAGPARGIYGRVTEAEREALADEGIETTQIPWLPRADG